MKHKILVLHNIRSAQNVGAMFRTAEAIKIDEIIISGYTASPIDRFGRLEKKIAKSALGAEQMVAWRYSKNIIETLIELKQEKYNIVCVEQTKNSVDYKIHRPLDKEVIIMGNEVEGVAEEILELSDDIIELPMYGEKESLNVATSCGIVLYRLFDRH